MLKFSELPKEEHEKLVRSYWETWLAAFNVEAENEQAVRDFIDTMEQNIHNYIEFKGFQFSEIASGLMSKDDDYKGDEDESW